MIALSLVVSGCSCTSISDDPGDGNGNTGNGNGNTGNGSTVNGGGIAAGVIVVLLVVAMVTGAVIVGILVWRRRRSSYFTTNSEWAATVAIFPMWSCVVCPLCSPLDVKSVMEVQVHDATPVKRVYEEPCEVKSQVLEPTAYEVPVNQNHGDMVCICMVCVCVCVCARVCALVCA